MTGAALEVNRVNASSMNVTISLFHLTNYEHVKHVPYYKISTPKSPIYTLEEERDRESAVINKTKTTAPGKSLQINASSRIDTNS